MDTNTPNPQTPQPNSNLIMPEELPTQVQEPQVPPVSPEPQVPPATVDHATDPLFAPVTEADPIEPGPATVMPAPSEPVTDHAMNQLDDGDEAITNRHGQTVVATSEPHKSRRKTMLFLVVGLLLVGAAGYAAYILYAKPNVVKTTTPSAIVSVDQLSPQKLTQATDKAELTAGAQTNSATLVFSGEAPANSPSGLKLQIEIQPIGTDFTGTPIDSTIAVPDSSSALKLNLTNYAAGSYHWRARLSDGTTNGPWVAYNTTDQAGKTADFVVDRTAPTAAVVKTVNGKAVKTKIVTSAVAMPVFAGTAEAGSTVIIAFGTTATYKATVGTDGTWTVTATAVLPNAKYATVITTTDVAGNAVTDSYTVTQAAK